MPGADVEHVEEHDNGFIRTRRVPKMYRDGADGDDRLPAAEARLADIERRLAALEKAKK